MIKHMLLVGLLVAGCGKKDGAAGGGGDGPTKADADAVNALIPADVKGKVEFEVATIDDGMGRHPTKYTVVAPKGWKKGFMPGSLEPADSDNFGSKTLGKSSFKVGSNCDGTCEKKDWAAVVDKVYYSQFTGASVKGKVVKDDKTPTGRTMIFEGEDVMGDKQTKMIKTWWTADSTKHYICEAELGAPLMTATAAFEKACGKVSISE